MDRGGLHADVGSGARGSEGSMGRGGMNGSGMRRGMGTQDAEIKASSTQGNPSGKRIINSVQILSSGVAGTRQVHLETDRRELTEPAFSDGFTVTKQNIISMGVTS